MKLRISLRRRKKPRIAVINITGVIQEDNEDLSPRRIAGALEELQERPPQAVILRLNTPGGTVGASQEIYESIVKFRDETKVPVVASMGDVTASGGVYVAMAADKVIANPGTVTGSIGVVIQSRNLSRLLDKVGVSAEVVKSGRYKDTLSMYRGLTKSERALLQSVIDDSHAQFLEVVTRGRKLTAKAVREFADGRVMTGRQAKKFGLVDELGGFDIAVDAAKKLANITEKPQFIEMAKPKKKWWERLSRRFINGWGVKISSSLPEGIPLYLMP
jgi:protease-4